MHTEQEASLLWCPHVRLPAQFQAVNKLAGGTIGIAAAPVNVEAHAVKTDAMTRNGGNVTCIGSKCSQWRWHPLVSEQRERIGYCGLSGAPLDGSIA